MTLLSSTRKAATLAPPLPLTNKILNSVGVTLRRGQFSIVASAPGVGKSLFATNLALHTQTPSLYFSADSDEWTQKQRACSILTGTKLTDVEKQLNEEEWDAYYAGILGSIDHVDFTFRSDPDLEYVALKLNAYAELRGQEYPHLIIVDNLGNTVEVGDDEGASLRAACRELQVFGRNLNAHVMALHHVKGPKEDGFKPIGMGDLLYNLGKIPETVIGLNRNGDGTLNVTVPKQRGGKSNFSFPLGIDYTTATLGGF